MLPYEAMVLVLRIGLPLCPEEGKEAVIFQILLRWDGTS